MPVACKPFSQATLRWDRFERFLAGGPDLTEADRGALLQAARNHGAGDVRAFGVQPAEIRRLRLERAIWEGARSDLAGRPQADDLFDRLRRYVRRAYKRERQAGTPSPGNVAEFLVLETNHGILPSQEYIRKVLTS